MTGRSIRNHRVFPVLSLFVLLMGASLAAQAQTSIVYAQLTPASPVYITSSQFADIPNLVVALPPASSTQKYALITLNVPAAYATGTNYPSITYGINFDGTVVAVGAFSYESQAPQSYGRIPVTVVTRVALKPYATIVRAQGVSIRNSTGVIDTNATLSAILGSD